MRNEGSHTCNEGSNLSALQSLCLLNDSCGGTAKLRSPKLRDPHKCVTISKENANGVFCARSGVTVYQALPHARAVVSADVQLSSLLVLCLALFPFGEKQLRLSTR